MIINQQLRSTIFKRNSKILYQMLDVVKRQRSLEEEKDWLILEFNELDKVIETNQRLLLNETRS